MLKLSLPRLLFLLRSSGRSEAAPAHQNAQTVHSEIAFTYIHGQPTKIAKLSFLMSFYPYPKPAHQNAYARPAYQNAQTEHSEATCPHIRGPHQNAHTEHSEATVAHIRCQPTNMLKLSWPLLPISAASLPKCSNSAF